MAELHLQVASEAAGIPGVRQFRTWTDAVLATRAASAELLIRVVDEPESRQLNRDYRGCDKATNVLSFGFDPPAETGSRHLGDIVICAPVVVAQAKAQGKAEQAHWAHMTVHGVLHLLGYDHQDAASAQEMETLEIAALAGLGFANPYRESGS